MSGSLSKRDDLAAIRERSRTWEAKNKRVHLVPNAGRASRDRQILLRALDALLADRRVTAPIDLDALVDDIVVRVHAEVKQTQRAVWPAKGTR